MTLLNPIWLFLLLPWAAVCLWTGRATGAAARVPFLSLWPKATTEAGGRRWLPPLWAVLVLAGIGLTILGAAGPAWRPAPAVVAVRPKLGNAKIERLTVTASPIAMAMVRISNTTTQTTATLRIDRITTSITLPADGKSGDYFVTLRSLGERCEAGLQTAGGAAWADDEPGDDTAVIQKTNTSARLDPQTPLSDALGRMVAVYGQHRPGGNDGPAIAIVRGVPPMGPAVILPTQIGPPAAGVTIVDSTHPLAKAMSVWTVAQLGRSTEVPAGEGWKPVVAISPGGPLLAVRETPARQVWVGADVDAMADKADYVVFWTDVFDWLGGGAPEWKPQPASAPTTRPNGTTVTSDPTPVSLAPWPLAAGLALVAAGLVTGASLTRF